MRSKIAGLLDSKLGPIAFSLGETGVVLYEPYLIDGKPACSSESSRTNSSYFIVRGIPYTAHLEFKIDREKDDRWVLGYAHIDRADSKRFDVRPSDSARNTIEAELNEVWVKYISQHPEFLAEVKIGAMERQQEELRTKNSKLQEEISKNEDEIKSIDFNLSILKASYNQRHEK